MRKVTDRLLEICWPWGRIKRLRAALAQALADNAILHQRLDMLTDRDAKGRFKKSS